MANTYWWVDGDGTSHSIYVAGVSTNSYVERYSEYGQDFPPEEHIVNQLPTKWSKRYRDTVYKEREYGFRVFLKRTSAGTLEAIKRTYNKWHDAEKGEGYIHRITHDGSVRVLDAIPNPPQWDSPEGFNIYGQLSYLASNPWWRSASQTTTSFTISGTATAYHTVSNPGDIGAFTDITITGIVKNPRIRDKDANFIEVRKSTSAVNDEIRVFGEPDNWYAKYYSGGAGDGDFCALTGGSQFWQVPTGTHSISGLATSTSGTVTIQLSYYTYYISL